MSKDTVIDGRNLEVARHRRIEIVCAVAIAHVVQIAFAVGALDGNH